MNDEGIYIPDDIAAEVDAEFAQLDDPALTDIELWEKHLGIDDAETRALFDERLVLKRAGVDLDEPWSDHNNAEPVVTRAFYATHAAKLRNPAPDEQLDPEDEGDRLVVIIEQHMFTRDALRNKFRLRRYEVLRAEQAALHDEQEADARRAALLAIPVVIEGELILAPTRHRSR